VNILSLLLLAAPLVQDAENEKERREKPAERPEGRPRPPLPPPPRGAPEEGPPRDREQRRPGKPPAGFPEEARAWLREYEPGTFRQLQAMEEQGRFEDVQRLLLDAGARMRETRDLKDRDPKAWERMQELRTMERRSFDLADRARSAAAADRERLQVELKELLGKLFDAREEQRGRELGEMKRRVAEIEKNLAERKANREKIVEKRRRELMGETLGEEW
jgi:hypothetical protein